MKTRGLFIFFAGFFLFLVACNKNNPTGVASKQGGWDNRFQISPNSPPRLGAISLIVSKVERYHAPAHGIIRMNLVEITIEDTTEISRFFEPGQKEEHWSWTPGVGFRQELNATEPARDGSYRIPKPGVYYEMASSFAEAQPVGYRKVQIFFL